ncbi:hypothetical protein BC829DRAFT_401355, partial [Chytridium lagenaria]
MAAAKAKGQKESLDIDFDDFDDLDDLLKDEDGDDHLGDLLGIKGPSASKSTAPNAAATSASSPPSNLKPSFLTPTTTSTSTPQDLPKSNFNAPSSNPNLTTRPEDPASTLRPFPLNTDAEKNSRRMSAPIFGAKRIPDDDLDDTQMNNLLSSMQNTKGRTSPGLSHDGIPSLLVTKSEDTPAAPWFSASHGALGTKPSSFSATESIRSASPNSLLDSKRSPPRPKPGVDESDDDIDLLDSMGLGEGKKKVDSSKTSTAGFSLLSSDASNGRSKSPLTLGKEEGFKPSSGGSAGGG